MLKKIGLGVLVLVVLLAVVLGFNTWRQSSRQIQVQPLAPLTLDENAAGQRLAAALQLKTVASRTDPQASADQFKALHELLAKLFPNVNAATKREEVGGFGLLYTWGGTDPKAAPILLLAHQDVAPLAASAGKDGPPPSFSAAVKDGAIWGHGLWDGKADLVAQLEAIDLLIAKNFAPVRPVYLAYSADAEAGSADTAKLLALLQQRGIRPAFVLSDGEPVLDGVVPGVARPTAFVGVASPGSEAIALRIPAPNPAAGSAADLMARVLQRLKANPFRAQLGGITARTLATLAPEMHGFDRVAFSNLWLFRPWATGQLEAVPATNAWLRTAVAGQPGDAGGGAGQGADAVLKVTLLPGTTPEQVLERVRKVVAGVVPANGFELTVLPGAEGPSGASSTDSKPYQTLDRTIREVFPGAVVAPAWAVHAGDANRYRAISDDVFSFSPLRADAADLQRMGGADAHLSVASYTDAVRFYHRLIAQLAGATPPAAQPVAGAAAQPAAK